MTENKSFDIRKIEKLNCVFKAFLYKTTTYIAYFMELIRLSA